LGYLTAAQSADIRHVSLVVRVGRLVELLAFYLALWTPGDAATEHRTLTLARRRFLNVVTTIIGMRRRLMSRIDALYLLTVVGRYTQTFATPADEFGSHYLILPDISLPR
jgi:hypothetical protein